MLPATRIIKLLRNLGLLLLIPAALWIILLIEDATRTKDDAWFTTGDMLLLAGLVLYFIVWNIILLLDMHRYGHDKRFVVLNLVIWLSPYCFLYICFR